MNQRLLNAARDGNLHLVKGLLGNHNADQNFRDANGDSPLHWAARAGQIEVIKYLLQRSDIDVCVENDDNDTAFDLAWNTANAHGNCTLLKTALETIGRAYIEKLQSIAAPSEVYLHQVPHIEAPETLYEATLVGNYRHKLSQDDLRGLLQFFCRPLLKERSSGQIMIAVTCMLDVAETKSVTLLKINEEVLFVPYWDKVPVDTGEAQYDIKVKAEGEDDVVVETVALLKLRVACDWLSTVGMPKQQKKMKGVNFDLEVLEAELRKQLGRVQSTEESFKEGRRLFAQILNETNSTDEKMEFISRFLRKSLDCKEGLGQFSFKTANGLIFFLEAFALEGISPGITMTPDATKRLSQKKKKYYLQFYPQKPSGKFYHDIIDTLRNSILHNGTNTSVSLDALDNFVKNDIKMSLEDFFKQLLGFSEYVWGNVQHQRHKQPEETDLETFFHQMKMSSNGFLKTESPPKDTGAPSEPPLRRFCENVKNMLQGIDVMHELLFDLVVNIQPKIQIDKSSFEKPAVHSLRNSVVHDFQNKSLQKLTEDIPFAVHDLYRYELASCINRILIAFREVVDPADIEQQFADALKSVDLKFKDFEHYPSNELRKGSFMCHYNNISWMRTSIYVEIYIEYMVPLFDVQREEDGQYSLMNNTQKYVNVMQKREVFELFWRLDDAFTQSNETEFVTIQKTLRRYLKENLHVTETEAHFVTELVEHKNFERNATFHKKIKGFLDSLDALMTEAAFKCKHWSRQDIIMLYSSVIKSKKPFSFRNNKDLLRSVELTDVEKAMIEDRLMYFPDCNQVEEIFSGSEKVEVNVSSVVLNLLKMSSEIQSFYQLKIEGVASVFSDETFLTYLMSHAVQRNTHGKMEFKDKNLTYKVIRDIRDINFTTPYVASILSKTRFLGVIEDDLLLKVIMSLIRCYPFAVYLKDLLSLNHKRVMGLLPKVLFEEEGLTDENMRTVLEAVTKAKVVDTSTKYLKLQLHHYPKEVDKIIRRYLWAANDVLLGFIDDNKLDDADFILDHISELHTCVTKQNHEDNEISAERNLLEAKIHKRRANAACSAGCKKGAKCCGYKYCVKAIHVLDQIPKPQDASYYPRYMLALTRKCDSRSVMGKCLRIGKSVTRESINYCEELLDLMWHYVTSEKTPAPRFEEFYSRVSGDEKYNNLIGSHREYSKFLNILKIQDTLSLLKLKVANKNPSFTPMVIDALRTWHALYAVRKKQGSDIYAKRAVIRFLRRIGFAHNELFKRYRHMSEGAVLARYHEIKCVQACLLNYRTSLLQRGPYAAKVRESATASRTFLPYLRFNWPSQGEESEVDRYIVRKNVGIF